MKTILNFRLITIALIMTTVMISMSSEAQTRRYSQNDTQNRRSEQVTNNTKTKKNNKSNKNKQNNKSYNKEKNNSIYTYKNKTRYEYNHPQYGHVYRKFYSNPVKLKHSNGYVYFYDNNYYRFQRGVGYIRISTPRNLVFMNLPSRMEHMRVGINTYYKYGNIVFERYNNGYKLASNISLNINLNF